MPSTAAKISVGPPYYALTFAPIFFALLLLVPFGPQTGLAARRSQGGLRVALARRWAWPASLRWRCWRWPARAALTGTLALRRGGLADRRYLLDIRKRKGARAAAFAAALAHAGLGITLMGVAGTTLWRSEALDVMGPGETMTCRTLHACASMA